MKRLYRISLFCLAMLMIFSLASCGKENDSEVEAPSGFLMAENENTDYYFFYPSDWLLDRNDAGMTSAFVSETDFSNVSVTAFTASASYTSLLDYVEKHYFAQFKDNFNQLEIERNQDQSIKRSSMKIDGADVIAVNYTAVFSGEEYSFRAWFISYNGYIYNVLYTAKTQVFNNHLEEATVIAEQLKFR